MLLESYASHICYQEKYTKVSKSCLSATYQPQDFYIISQRLSMGTNKKFSWIITRIIIGQESWLRRVRVITMPCHIFLTILKHDYEQHTCMYMPGHKFGLSISISLTNVANNEICHSYDWSYFHFIHCHLQRECWWCMLSWFAHVSWL